MTAATKITTLTAALAAAAIATLATLPTTTHAWELGSGNRVYWESNCDFYGGDLYATKQPSEKCGDLCADDPKCTHWTWEPQQGCWMKSGATAAKRAAANLGCGFVIGRFVPAGETPTTTPAPGYNNGLTAQETQQMLDSINSLRRSNGLSALTIDTRLMNAAAGHSRDQAARCTMGHTGGDGKSFGDRITAQGYRWGQAAENVAAGYGDVAGVMSGWSNSPSHRANLLSAGVTQVGFAKGVNSGCNGYKEYWTQDFARPQ